MTLTERMVDIVFDLYNQHKNLANGDDDERRELTRMMAEQFCYEFGSTWGTKKAGSGNPQSKDSIAMRLDSEHFDSWDWQNGSTREPQVYIGMPPQFPNVGPPQEFIFVSPVNHLGDVPEPPPPDDELEARVAKLEEDNTAQANQIQTLSAELMIVNAKLNAMETIIPIGVVGYIQIGSARIPVRCTLTYGKKQ